jgi:hypothetical protein
MVACFFLLVVLVVLLHVRAIHFSFLFLLLLYNGHGQIPTLFFYDGSFLESTSKGDWRGRSRGDVVECFSGGRMSLDCAARSKMGTCDVVDRRTFSNSWSLQRKTFKEL